MRPTLALALAATAATLTSPVLASSPAHASHGQGLVKRHVAAEGGVVRRMVRRVRRAEGAAVLSLSSNSSTTTSSSTTSEKKKQYTSTAIWWAEAGWIGSCGEVISDTENVLALPLSLYPSPSSPSPLCGQTLTLTAPSTGKSLTARVVGASDREDYTAMSKAAFQALGGDLEGGEVGVVMEFVEGDVAIPSSVGEAATSAVQSGAGKVVAAASSSPASAAAQTTTTQAAKTSSPAPTTTQAPTTQAQAKQTTTTATTTSSWDSATAASKSSADAAWASSSSAAAAAAAASKSSADSAWASSSSAAAYKMWASSSSSAAAAAASKSSADAAWASSSSAAAAAASKSSADAAWASSSSAAAAAKATQTSSSGGDGGSSGGSGGGKVYTGGIATFFYQNGVAGNCGQVNSDDSYIVALPTSTYAGGSHCGQSVKITRSDTGQSITAKVADSCPTCNNASCLDLSVGAYKALGGTDSMGVFDITWQFV